MMTDTRLCNQYNDIFNDFSTLIHLTQWLLHIDKYLFVII